MKLPKNREADDIDGFYSSLLGNPRSKRQARELLTRVPGVKQLEHRQKVRKQAQRERKKRETSIRNHYQRSVFGMQEVPLDQEAPSRHAKNLGRALASTPRQIQRWLGSHRAAVVMAGCAFLFVIGTVGVFKVTSKNDTAPDQATNIAPETTLVPKEIPAGFSAGSSLQTLDNGATVYTMYSDKGYEISVTQQAKDANFSQPIIRGASAFTTPKGRAFILDEPDRITGYLFTDKTWVLFNSVGDLTEEDLRILIESF